MEVGANLFCPMAAPANSFAPPIEPVAPVEVGASYDVAIEKLVYGGDGLARIGRQAVFVPLTAPGDRARIRLTEVSRNFARGELLELLDPSPARRTPPCPYFGQCGGCQMQHLTYPAQLEVKAEFVRESLRRMGGIEWGAEIPVLAADELGYRARAELKVEQTANAPRIGYYRAGSRDIVDVAQCPILLPAANRELARLHAEPSLVPNDATRVYLTVGDDEVIVTPATGEGARAVEIDALGTAHQRIGGIDYGFGVRSFFQGNRLLVEKLVEAAVGAEAGAVAIDLYAGVGLFSLQLARKFGEVYAVEGNRAAATHAVANARANHITNVRSEPISVEAWLKYKSHDLPRPDFILLDPPRAGAGAAVIERLAAIRAPRVTYVSCDPTTLARDLKLLVGYGYTLNSVTAVDLFPQTFHIETIAKLSLGVGEVGN